jgi:hypothetical protein
MMSKTILVIAKEFGKLAFQTGNKSVPAQDANCMKLITDHSKEFGDSIHIMKAWNIGWHEENAK